MIDLFGPLELTQLRAVAAAALPDQGRIMRPGTGGTVDGNGNYIPNPGTTIYDGPMRIRTATVADSAIVFGDTQVSQSRLVAVLPYDAPEIDVDDVLYVDTSSDPNIGPPRSFRIRVAAFHSYLTDRRLGIEIVE